MAVVRFDAILTKAHGAITNSYTTIGAALTQNWRVVKITNNTDGDMLLSLNGTTDNIFVPAFGFTLYDLSTNAVNVQQTDSFIMQLGSQFYIKYSTAPTEGDVWIEGVYARGV
jgi:hypothetical protein